MEVNLKLELWPRQLQALKSPATELLFGGATEGGKSHMVRIALITWCLAVKGLQCVLIRKKYDDILKNHVEGPTGFKALLKPLIDLKLVEVTQREVRFLCTGSLIAFQHCQDERQFTSAQGIEKHVLVIDEATQISERLIKFFKLWVRAPKDWKETLPPEYQDKFPCIIYTANPIGPSVPYFRRHFVKARPAFQMEKVDGFLRQFIPSRYTDNLSVDEEAHKGRMAGIGDTALARALDEGDWDAPLGDYFPEYSDDKHVIPDFTPAPHLFKFRTLDLGYQEPFAVYWFCVADGQPFKARNGEEIWVPSGSLIAYREWYGCDPEDPAKGIRMRNNDIARGILMRTPEATSNITLSDSLPFQDRGQVSPSTPSKRYTAADAFAEEGCPLTPGNTQRVQGWSQLRDRLIGIEGIPLIYFTESCAYARDYLPALPRHDLRPEDAAEHGEATHAPDAIRLACTARPLTIKKGNEASEKVSKLTPRGIIKSLTPKKAAFTRR